MQRFPKLRAEDTDGPSERMATFDLQRRRRLLRDTVPQHTKSTAPMRAAVALPKRLRQRRTNALTTGGWHGSSEKRSFRAHRRPQAASSDHALHCMNDQSYELPARPQLRTCPSYSGKATSKHSDRFTMFRFYNFAYVQYRLCRPTRAFARPAGQRIKSASNARKSK